MDFIIGGMAGAGATIFTNPMDVVKTRLQLQGELRKRTETVTRYRGMAHALYVIAKTDGPLALQKGLLPAMVFGFSMNSVRLGLFHVAQVQGWTKNKNRDVKLEKLIFWSATSGVLSGFLSNNAAVIKTRMQAAAHPSIAVGKQYVYKGMWDGFVKMYKTEGFSGFFAGVNAACLRLAIGSAAQLTTFSTATGGVYSTYHSSESVSELIVESSSKQVHDSSALTMSGPGFAGKQGHSGSSASGMAGAGATIFTNPMDVVKTRLQLQGELRKRTETVTRYRGMAHALYVIAKTDGPLALQKGLLPAMVFGFSMNSVRLGLFHVAQVQGWTKNKNGDVKLEKLIFWSATSGVLSGFLANPASVIKTRMQAAAHPSIAVGRQYVYKGMWDGFVKMYKTEGFRGLFAGVNAACSRLAIGSAAQLTTFSTVKVYLVTHGFGDYSKASIAFIASLVCGVLCVIVETPLDVINTRLYNQGPGTTSGPMYSGAFDCLRKIYKTEGLHGLYKGIGPLYLRIAPHTTLSLVIWDMLNIFFNRNKNR